MNTEAKHPPTEDRPVQRVIGRAFQVAVRLRLGGALLLWTVATLHACFDPVPWKIALATTVGSAMALVTVWDARRFGRAPLSAPQVAWVMGTIYVGYAVLLLLTGGLRSPFLLMLSAQSLGMVVGTGLPRLFLPPVLFLVLVVWLLALAEIHGVPADQVPAAPSVTLSLTLAAFATAAIALPAAIMLWLRRALEDAVAVAIRARAEHVATLQSHNAELMELSRTVAHELKNPLASIQGLATLLARRQVAGSREAERAGVLVDETRRLAALLDEFLNFGRPVQGLAVRPVEARELFARVANLVEARLHARELRLDTDLRTVAPLRCDPRKLEQVLFNLVDNAVEASPPGARITLRVDDDGDGGHTLTVLDEGPGLAPEVRARLFQPGTTTRPGGSGLGLAIVRMIARQHNGDVQVDDRPEGGCAVRIHLPRASPSPAAGTGAES